MCLSSSQIEAIKQGTEHFFGTQAEVHWYGAHGIGKVKKKIKGFTLVELIMTMVIVGILAAVAAPRFFDTNVFQSRGFADQVQASLRYAQKVAIAQRRSVCVAFDSVAVPNNITLTIDSDTPPDGACNPAPAGNLQSPSGDASYVISAPDGVAFGTAPAPVDFRFNALGTPTNAPQAISITGAANAILIEAETGYVH
jgi:MSHA pilin protein MshC